MPERILTFQFLERDIINSINLIKDKNDALLVGGFSGAVMDLLGRCLLYPQKGNTERRIKKFIEIFLKKQNSQYSKFADFIFHDLRKGGAHSILPKSAITLTGHVGAKNSHLKFIENTILNRYSLIVFTPQFMEDLGKAVLNFVKEARIDSKLANAYSQILDEVVQQGQDFAKREIKNGLLVDSKMGIYADIHR